MSYALSSIKQIRWPVEEDPYGFAQLIINRPGTTALDVAATDTLLISHVDPSIPATYPSPELLTNLPISKKTTTTKGRRALDDLTITLRDKLTYTGFIDSVLSQENFEPTYQTFFNVFFNSQQPYKTFILWKDKATGAFEVCFEGWIDSRYKPGKNPHVYNPGTLQQIWLGDRTLKIIEGGNAITKTWQDVLDLIREVDCQAGTPYLGYMAGPPGCAGKKDSRAHVFPTTSSEKGPWYLAVPHAHVHDGGDARVLRRIEEPVWPDSPFTNNTPSSIATFHIILAGWNFNTYHYGDRGEVDGGSPNATYIFSRTPNGQPSAPGGMVLTATGTGYVVGSTYATHITTGSGDGSLQIIVDSVSTKSVWGPSGFVFISIGTLFKKIAAALDLETPFVPSTDLKSALSWWAQKWNGFYANGAFPIDDSAEISIDELFVNLNVIAKSHPADGSFMDNPVGWSPEAPINDVLNGLCNLILSDFNLQHAPDGTSALALNAMGNNSIALPDSWQVIGEPSQEEPSTGPRSVAVHNRGDNLKIQAPYGVPGDLSEIEVPFRIKPVGATSGRPNSDNVVDKTSMLFDGSKKIEEQADECLKVYWEDENGALVTNPNIWKSLCYVFWFDGSNPASSPVYPDTWSPFPNNDGTDGTWENSFYVVNAVFKGAETPATDLMGVTRGDEYFNTRNYHAVAFGVLSIALPIVQVFQYSGISDATGSVQNCNPGVHGQWLFEGNSQNWRAIEMNPEIGTGTTSVKWQGEETSGAFPNLTDLAASPIGTGGGTSTGTGGGGVSGGIPGGVDGGGSHFQFDSVVDLTGVNPQMSTKDVLYRCSDAATTGVLAASTLQPGTTFGLKNNTPNNWTSSGGGDFYVPSGAFWLLIYHGATGHTDVTLPEGWSAIRDQ